MRRLIAAFSSGCLLVLLLSASPVADKTHKPVVGITVPDTETMVAVEEASSLYNTLQLEHCGLNIQVLEYALKGFNYLQKKGIFTKKDILSICDFSQSSKNKRLYIIDVDSKKLVLNTYVAHGRNSGSEYARSFSNSPESLKSSLGFYVTRDTYTGAHGLSLKIDGLEKGFNDKAGERNIVVHGCEYLGNGFLRNNNFSGRSWGCPAVPANQTAEVINTIKGGTCLFIYHPTKQYLAGSKVLNS